MVKFENMKYYNDHGVCDADNTKPLKVKILVPAGKSTISLGGCAFAGDATMITAETEGITPASANLKTSSDNTAIDFAYEGEAAELVFSITGGAIYLHNIKVVSPEIEDPDATPKPEITSNDYEIKLNDASNYVGNTEGSAFKPETIAALEAKGITFDSDSAFHDATHGSMNVNSIDIDAVGPLKVTIGVCAYGSMSSGELKDASGNVLWSKKFNQVCYGDKATEGNGYEVLYYPGPDAGKVKVEFNNAGYIHYLKIENVEASAVPTPAKQATVTYSFGDDAAVTGDVPAEATVDVGEKIAVTKYRAFYKEGYTFTAWTPDNGTTQYKIGESITVDKDMTLTPVFTQNDANAVPVGDVVFDFQTRNGAPTIEWQNANKIYVAQGTTADGKPIDVKADVDTNNGGKLANKNWTDWAQCNPGTKFTVPIYGDSVITMVQIMNADGAYTIDGTEKVGSDQSVTVSGKASADIVITGNIGYIRSFSVKYPAAN